MKELSIKEKAKRYDEALEKSKRLYEQGTITESLCYVFPELKESEDEEIREALLEHIKGIESWEYFLGISKEQMIAWLEKQGEQKEYTFKSLPRLLDMIEPTSKAKAYCQKLIDALVKEGYTTDAKIVGECLKAMNGENVPMAIMDEKQGEQKPVDIPKFRVGDFVKDANYHGEPTYEIVGMDGECYICQYRGNKSMGDRSVMHFCFDNPYLRLVEQKPVDKIEPKFKVGNWYQCTKDFFGKGVTFDKNTAYYCAKEGCLQNEYGCHIAIVKDLYDNFKLWTIQDAKDGDVLCAKNKSCPFIYDKDRYNNGLAYYYVGIDVSGNLNIKSPHNMLAHFGRLDDIRPATKEQRDFLFQKMKEAGYEWDAEKKELKKIEQKPAWSEEDERLINRIEGWLDTLCDYLKDSSPECIEDVKDIIEHLKSLKDRVQPQPKQEWSKEDEKHIHSIISTIECCRKENEQSKVIADCYTSDLEWFKSLMNRCKPSEDLPHWKKGTLKGKNVTGFNSDFFSHNGYYINYNELFDKLPKDD